MPQPATFLQGSRNDLGLFFCLRKPLPFASVSLLPWPVPQVHSNILVLSLSAVSLTKDNLISPDLVLV